MLFGVGGEITADPNAFNYDSLATYDDGSCLYPDCNGIAYGTSLLDSCGVCQQAYIYDVVLHTDNIKLKFFLIIANLISQKFVKLFF